MRAIRRDSTGSVLPIVAASILVIVGLIGGGLDASRMYKTRNALQAACDAGVLAGRRAVTTSGLDAAAKAQAQTYFDANFDPDRQGSKATSFATSTQNEGNSVDGTASTDLPMLMMQLFGFSTVHIATTCSATMGVGNSDVTMVLDTTGSMNDTLSGSQTKIQALRAAMTNFYDTVASATQGSNARIRYAIVPYASTVNVGHQLMDLDPDYLADTWGYQTRVPRYNEITEQYRSGWSNPTIKSQSSYDSNTTSTDWYSSTQYSKKNDCTSAQPRDVAWKNTGSPSYSTTTVEKNGQQIVDNMTIQPQIQYSYQCVTQRDSRGQKYYQIQVTTDRRNYIDHQLAISDPIYSTRSAWTFDHFDYKWADTTTTLDNKTKFLDLAAYKAGNTVTTYTGDNGGWGSSYQGGLPVQSTWAGCIEERSTVATGSISYSSVTGMSPSDAADLDIDSLPTSSDPDSQWKVMWPEVSYYRTPYSNGSVPAVSTSGSEAQRACPAQVRIMQEMGRDTFIAAENALSPNGGTYHDIGMVWGARISSPQGPWADTLNDPPSNGGEVSRHIVFMTDGIMDTGGRMYNAWGIEPNDKRITSDGSSSQSNTRHALRFRALCDAVKAKGIRIWVIGFTTSLNSDLNYCASPNSAFTANDAAQLNTAFQEIAKQVGELRVQL